MFDRDAIFISDLSGSLTLQQLLFDSDLSAYSQGHTLYLSTIEGPVILKDSIFRNISSIELEFIVFFELIQQDLVVRNCTFSDIYFTGKENVLGFYSLVGPLLVEGNTLSRIVTQLLGGTIRFDYSASGTIR